MTEASGQRNARPQAQWDLVSTAGGMVFAVLALVAYLLTGRMGANKSNAEILRFFAAHKSAIEVQAILFGFAALALLWFAGRLAGLLRGPAEEPTSRIPTIVVAGAAASVAVFLVGVAAFTALAQHSGSPGTSRSLFDLGELAFGLSAFTAATFLEGAAVGILRTGLLPRWVGLAGALLVSLLLVDGIVRTLSTSRGAAVLGAVTFFLFLAWVFLVSALLALAEVQRRPA
jgi:hypothetical protein